MILKIVVSRLRSVRFVAWKRTLSDQGPKLCLKGRAPRTNSRVAVGSADGLNMLFSTLQAPRVGSLPPGLFTFLLIFSCIVV